MKIFITGTPRSGTGFAAQCLQDIGYDVQHEAMGRHGTSNWQYVAPIETPWYGEPCDVSNADVRVLLMRDPIAVISSISRIMAYLPEQMGEYVTVTGETKQKKAATAVLGWLNLALDTMQPTHVIRTEDFLFFCEKQFGKLPDRGLVGYNGKEFRWSQITKQHTLTAEEIIEVAPELTELYKLRKLCTT